MAKGKKRKTSSMRKDSSIIERDIALEKSLGIDDMNLYYYKADDGLINIIGELFSAGINDRFQLICTTYDSDDDVIESERNRGYGAGCVSSIIKPETFFNGYPFRFYIFSSGDEKRISIIPEKY